MKLHFESDLPYQAAAIEAVCDLFRGQEVCRSVFTVTAQALADSGQQSFEGKQFTAEGGIGNALQLLIDEELSENLQKVQLRNGLQPSDPLNPKQALDFTVEMETGTGKTYVYLRTVFELNQRYGFTKFVVVVPSVAIKEGVNKTLQITREHFEGLYPGAKGYEFFQYDSDRLGAGIDFGVVKPHVFSAISVEQENGELAALGFEASKTLWTHLKAQGYITDTFESLLEQEFPEGASREQKKKTKESVLDKYPYPNLEVVSLASEESLEAFVERFDKLKSFSIKLLKPNNEINNDGLFKKFRAQGNQLHASSATVSYRNPEGLVKGQVKDHAESALDGNAEVALSGTDTEGRKLSGTNDDFKIQVLIEGVPKVMKQAAQKLYSIFATYKKSGQVRIGAQEISVEKEVKLVRLAQQFSGGQDGNT